MVEVNQPGTMDNYRIFLHFFEVDRSLDMLDYEVLLSGFKTLFPQYVLQNEHIQHQISEAQGYQGQQPQPLFDADVEFEEFFNFREDDTFAIISKTTYSQDKEVFLEDEYEAADLSPERKRSSGSIELRAGPVVVRHCLEFEKVRLLYTNKI